MEKFSQAELALDAGLGRASLSNYEYGITALPFSAGIKLCRRLDLNQGWLATGREPQRPYVPLSELGISAESEELYEGTFLDGFNELLAAPLMAWKKQHPAEALVLSNLRGGPGPLFARMSRLGLERFIREWSAKLREESDQDMKLCVLLDLEASVAELKRRLGGSNPRTLVMRRKKIVD